MDYAGLEQISLDYFRNCVNLTQKYGRNRAIVAISYLAVAGMLFSCAKFAVVSPVPAEETPEVSEASPA